MKKRLIALMLAGVLTMGTMVGCSAENEPKSSIDLDQKNAVGHYSDEAGRIVDQNISVEQKDKYVLHKGDIVFFQNKAGQASTFVDVQKMIFDCGKEINTNATYYLSDEIPTDEWYDEICEECFDIN